MDKVESSTGGRLLRPAEQSSSESISYDNKGATGATMHQQPMHRAMKYYPIAKPELDQLSQLNVISTICFAIASMACTSLIGFIWDVVNTPTEDRTVVGGQLILVSSIATVIFLIIAIWMTVWKGSKKRAILTECESTPPSIET